MGWDSELDLDGDMLGQWRKHAPTLPALLFRRSDVVIIPPEAGDEDEQDSVLFQTTAAEALANLAASGFAWEHLLRDYAESRDFGWNFNWLRGYYMATLTQRKHASLLSKVEKHPPASDLQLLAKSILAEQRAVRAWYQDVDSPAPPTPLRDAVLFAEPVEGHELLPLGNVSDVKRCVLTRAADYFIASAHSAPLVGWALTMVQVLHHAKAGANLTFDISGGFDEASHGKSIDYANDYWQTAQGELASIGRFYGHIFAGLTRATTEIAVAARYGQVESLLANASETRLTNAQKGQRLEDLIAALFELPGSGLVVIEKRLKHEDEELDLVLRNDLDGPFWKNFHSPVVLVECKNWSKRVDINELRVLETKMNDRQHLCRVGMFIALNGFSKPFLARVRELQGKGMTVFPLDGVDLRDIVTTRRALSEWLSTEGLKKLL